VKIGCWVLGELYIFEIKLDSRFGNQKAAKTKLNKRMTTLARYFFRALKKANAYSQTSS